MSRTALVCPGQGSQKPGATAELGPEVEAIFRLASEAIGLDLWAAAHNASSDELTRPSLLQPLLVVWAMADVERARCASPGLVTPDYLLGHSSGVNSTLVLSGALPFQAGLRFAYERGLLQDAACDAEDGGLLAVSGIDRAAVEALASEAGVVLANINAVEQFVLAGSPGDLDRAAPRVEGAGGRVVRLRLAGAFHSEQFRTADEASDPLIAALPLAETFTPLIGNASGQLIRDPEALREELSMQFVRPVEWTAALTTAYEQGVRTFLVTGPGNAMAGLIRRFGRTTSERIRIKRLNAPADRSEAG